ncbi:hypothetical protein GCM10010302_17460 [Streptomyces polychromogenes]|uniref:Uncharacterized protein n=1 Tax=Streptomyces polychromogenes TaxID=67342 RepID=A0ABN0V849_9ACTN
MIEPYGLMGPIPVVREARARLETARTASVGAAAEAQAQQQKAARNIEKLTSPDG